LKQATGKPWVCFFEKIDLFIEKRNNFAKENFSFRALFLIKLKKERQFLLKFLKQKMLELY
jgi:hypothetical protein